MAVITTKRLATSEKILDSAEALFAESSYDAVSLRHITKHAGVELALPNYYFGTKLGLFKSVIERRSTILNRERIAALKSLPISAPIESIIIAFTEPFLRRTISGEAGWKNYARLIAQTANSPKWSEEIMSLEFDPVALEFICQVKTCFPFTNDENIFWGFHFLLGAMTITFAQTGRIDILSDGLCKASDLVGIHRRMVPFLSAGFISICEPPIREERFLKG